LPESEALALFWFFEELEHRGIIEEKRLTDFRAFLVLDSENPRIGSSTEPR
jgi:hypothetical protein